MFGKTKKPKMPTPEEIKKAQEAQLAAQKELQERRENAGKEIEAILAKYNLNLVIHKQPDIITLVPKQ